MKRDEGFTTLEALVAIALISISAAMIGAGFFAVMKSLGSSKASMGKTADMLNSDRILRQALNEVRLPYWVRKPKIVESEGRIEIPYYKGKAEDRITFLLASPNRADSNPEPSADSPVIRLRASRINLWKLEDGSPCGIKAQYEGSPVVESLGRFGSLPLRINAK